MQNIILLNGRSLVNGRAYTTVLHPSVCHWSSVVCDVCIVAKRCILYRAKVVVYDVVYEESIGTKMNDLDLCLETL